MARRKRSGFGMHHKPTASHRAWRGGIAGTKKVSITVSIGRNPTMNDSAMFTAIACAKHKGRSVKASHCGAISGGTTPTKATARALASLAASLAKAR